MASPDSASSPPALLERVRRLAAPGHGPAASTTSSGSSAASSTGPSPSSACRPRRCTGPADGRRMSGCRSCSTSPRPAGCWTPPRRCPTTRGRIGRGPTYHASSPSATGSGCAPARRAGFASTTSTPTGSCSSCGAASSARAVSSLTGRASANCWPASVERPWRGTAATPAVQLRRPAQHPPGARRARCSTDWSIELGLPGPRRRRPATSALPASLVRGGVPAALVSGRRRPARPGSTGCRPSWATSTRPPPPST